MGPRIRPIKLYIINMIRYIFIAFLFICFLQSCSNDITVKNNRPKDPWAFRSVLDRQPRMITLALDTAMYVAYDLAHCRLTKVWKGGVSLEGAAFTNKKNVQPVSWGTPYSDTLYNKWVAEKNGVVDSIKIISKGYRFDNNQIFLKYILELSSKDSVEIEERPEFVRNKNGKPGLERQFNISKVPDGVTISLVSASNKFQLKSNGITIQENWYEFLPEQHPVASEGEYDHRGRYWMEKSDCFTCHELDKKTVGPALVEVAAKYGDQEGVPLGLINKVKTGGSGVWGTAAMNAHPDLTDAEIKEMLGYIFSLKPASKLPAVDVPTELTKKQSSRSGFGAPLEGVHPSYDLQTIHRYNFNPRVGGLAFLPDGRLLVTTWDSIGAVYLLDHIETGDTNQIQVKRIASGLAEPLGITVVGKEIYVLQKHELIRLTDTDGDDIIDEYRTICNSWGVTGDFHEFAFGLVYKEGYFYATLSMAMRLLAHEKQQPDRGKTIKISRDGSYEAINYGLRTPNGIGIGTDNEIFVTDNQGEWEPANKMIHVKKGEYHGMRWGILDNSEPPAIALPALWLPEDEIGNSPTEPVLINEGIFKGQMLHGDVTYGGIQRDFLEKINGQYQGAVFRFTQGLEAGVNRMRWGPDGALYIGGVGMVGGWSWKEKQSGLQRLKFNGKPTFEMLAVRALPGGFDIEMTEPLPENEMIDKAQFLIQQWWYLNTENYGGPKKDLENLNIKDIRISEDHRHILLDITGLKKGHAVYIRLPDNLKSKSGKELWSSETWYTLNEIPNP